MTKETPSKTTKKKINFRKKDKPLSEYPKKSLRKGLSIQEETEKRKKTKNKQKKY